MGRRFEFKLHLRQLTDIVFRMPFLTFSQHGEAPKSRFALSNLLTYLFIGNFLRTLIRYRRLVITKGVFPVLAFCVTLGVVFALSSSWLNSFVIESSIPISDKYSDILGFTFVNDLDVSKGVLGPRDSMKNAYFLQIFLAIFNLIFVFFLAPSLSSSVRSVLSCQRKGEAINSQEMLQVLSLFLLLGGLVDLFVGDVSFSRSLLFHPLLISSLALGVVFAKKMHNSYLRALVESNSGLTCSVVNQDTYNGDATEVILHDIPCSSVNVGDYVFIADGEVSYVEGYLLTPAKLSPGTSGDILPTGSLIKGGSRLFSVDASLELGKQGSFIEVAAEYHQDTARLYRYFRDVRDQASSHEWKFSNLLSKILLVVLLTGVSSYGAFWSFPYLGIKISQNFPLEHLIYLQFVLLLIVLAGESSFLKLRIFYKYLYHRGAVPISTESYGMLAKLKTIFFSSFNFDDGQLFQSPFIQRKLIMVRDLDERMLLSMLYQVVVGVPAGHITSPLRDCLPSHLSFSRHSVGSLEVFDEGLRAEVDEDQMIFIGTGDFLVMNNIAFKPEELITENDNCYTIFVVLGRRSLIKSDGFSERINYFRRRKAKHSLKIEVNHTIAAKFDICKPPLLEGGSAVLKEIADFNLDLEIVGDDAEVIKNLVSKVNLPEFQAKQMSADAGVKLWESVAEATNIVGIVNLARKGQKVTNPHCLGFHFSHQNLFAHGFLFRNTNLAALRGLLSERRWYILLNIIQALCLTLIIGLRYVCPGNIYYTYLAFIIGYLFIYCSNALMAWIFLRRV